MILGNAVFVCLVAKATAPVWIRIVQIREEPPFVRIFVVVCATLAPAGASLGLGMGCRRRLGRVIRFNRRARYGVLAVNAPSVLHRADATA